MRNLKIIKSISEYLEYLSTLKQVHNTTLTVSSFTFFRGQANSHWNLSPSLYRKGLFNCESTLLTQIKHVCPNEIPTNRFDALVKMQHYGMPTRLLDTTTNPLVALYFACESQSEKGNNGAVYVFPNLAVSWSTDPLVALIMDFIFDYSPHSVHLDEMLIHAKEKYADSLHRLMPKDIDSLLYYLTIPAFPVMPAKTNERIEAQDGAFFIFGMSLRSRKVSTNPGTFGNEYCNFTPIKIKSPEQMWGKAETLIVPASVKDTILEQLDILGINEGKLFPDLSHQISHTVKSINKNEFK